MVKAMVDIDEHANRILNIIKAKYDLKDKSQAINIMAIRFEEEILEPELKPEFARKLREREKEKAVHVKDFEERYGLN